jgi:translation initiation factor IF-2
VAVRIYSLAKDLGIDSKELVDLCARIGIQGKGSALASLENDEIAKIKNHLAEKSAPAPEAAKESPKPQREPVKDAPIRDLGRPVTAKREIGSIRRPAAVSEGGSEAGVQASEVLGAEVSSGGATVPSVQAESRPESVSAEADDREAEGTDREVADGESPGVRVGRVPAVAQGLGSEGSEAVESDESDGSESSDLSNAPKGDAPASVPAMARSRDSRVAEPSRDFTSMNVPGKCYWADQASRWGQACRSGRWGQGGSQAA